MSATKTQLQDTIKKLELGINSPAMGEQFKPKLRELLEKSKAELAELEAAEKEAAKPAPSPEKKEAKQEVKKEEKDAKETAKKASAILDKIKKQNKKVAPVAEPKKEVKTKNVKAIVSKAKSVKKIVPYKKSAPSKADAKIAAAKKLAIKYRKKQGLSTKKSNIEKDSERAALPAGKRITDGSHYPYIKGNIYYEKRENRTDRKPNKYPRLEEGGRLENKLMSYEDFKKHSINWSDKRNYGKGVGVMYNPYIKYGDSRHDVVSFGSHEFGTKEKNDTKNYDNIYKSLYEKYKEENGGLIVPEKSSFGVEYDEFEHDYFISDRLKDNTRVNNVSVKNWTGSENSFKTKKEATNALWAMLEKLHEENPAYNPDPNKMEEGGELFAVGGMLEHGLHAGDTVIETYKDYGIIKNNIYLGDAIYVYDPNVGERHLVANIDVAKSLIDEMDAKQKVLSLESITPKKDIPTREEYLKLLQDYDRLGAIYEDTEDDAVLEDLHKQMDEMESKINLFERSNGYKLGGTINRKSKDFMIIDGNSDVEYAKDFDFFVKHQIGVSKSKANGYSFYSKLEKRLFKMHTSSEDLSKEEIVEICKQIHNALMKGAYGKVEFIYAKGGKLSNKGAYQNKPESGKAYTKYEDSKESNRAKPAGWRYTNAGAKRLKVSNPNTYVSKDHLAKYKGMYFTDAQGNKHRYIYIERRADKSDIKRGFPYLEKGGELNKYAIVDENTDRIYIKNTDKDFIDLKYKELKEIYPNDKLSIVVFKNSYAKGGSIPNNYAGKTAEQVWSEWTISQKEQFLLDHSELLDSDRHENNLGNSRIVQKDKNYSDLTEMTKRVLSAHVEKGQYENGGELEILMFKKNPFYELGDVVAYKDEFGEHTKTGKVEDIVTQDGIKLYKVEGSIGLYSADELRPVNLMSDNSISGIEEDQATKVYVKSNKLEGKAYFKQGEGIYVKFDDGSDGFFSEDEILKLEDKSIESEVSENDLVGHEIDVYGYQTKHLDLHESAIELFKSEIDKIESSDVKESIKAERKAALADCAKKLDAILGTAKQVYESPDAVNESLFTGVLVELQLMSVYWFKSGATADLLSLPLPYIWDIAGKINVYEKDEEVVIDYEIEELADGNQVPELVTENDTYLTLDEYNNQQDPKRGVKVLLTEDDYAVADSYKQGEITLTHLYINGFPYEYIKKSDEARLYTSDGDGNPQKLTVFYIDDLKQ